MRTLVLRGHERPISILQFSRESDLLFTASADSRVTAWYTHNGERLGTYDGHKGAIRSIDLSDKTTRLLTGSFDWTVKLWEAHTGTEIKSWDCHSPVRSVSFSTGERMFLSLAMGGIGRNKSPQLHVFQLSDEIMNEISGDVSKDPFLQISLPSRPTDALWGPMNDYIITSDEDGYVRKWSVETSQEIASARIHEKFINRISHSPDRMSFVSASSDHTAKLVDMETLEVVKVYKSNAPVSEASVSPIMDHVLLCGGQEASRVTTTSSRAGKFATKLVHKVYEEDIGVVQAHFGTVNAIRYSCDGKSFATGGEDGYARLHFFDDEYFRLT